MKPYVLRSLGLVALLGTTFYLGRRTAPHSVEKTDGGTQWVVGESAGTPTKPSLAGLGGKRQYISPAKNWTPLTGSADEFLKRLFEEPGVHETQYLLYRSIEEASPQQLKDWAAELATIPASRAWQPETFKTIAKRWAEIDATEALDWAQSLPTAQGNIATAAVLGGIAEADASKASALAEAIPSGPAKNAALIAVADVLRKTDPAGAIKLLGDANSYDAQRVTSEAFATWAASDPTSAAAAAAKMPMLQGENRSMYSVYQSWALQDPLTALTSAGGLPPGEKKDTAMKASLAAWAQRDPDAALAHCKALPTKDQTIDNLGSVLAVFAKSNPQKAIAALEGLPAKTRIDSIQSLASGWAASDLDGALAWANGLKNSKEKSSAMSGLSSELANLEPARRQAIIDSLPSGKARNDFVGQLINQTGYQDPIGAAKMIEAVEPHARQQILNSGSLMYYLSKSDPETAFRLAASLPGRHNHYLGQSLAEIAASDPARAEKLAMQLDPEQQRNALPSLYGKLAVTDGPGALAKARALADGATRANVLSSIFSGWASSDADAVLAWANQATDPTEKNNAFTSALNYKAEMDPTGAAKLADTYLRSLPADSQNSSGHGLANSVGTALFQDNPQDAARWVTNLPSEELQKIAVSNLASNWVNSDPAEASVWIRSLPTGSSKDGAINQLIEGIVNSDPTSALAWAGSISDESTRSGQMQNVFHNWLANDKAAALAALNAAPMDEATKESLRQRAAVQ